MRITQQPIGDSAWLAFLHQLSLFVWFFFFALVISKVRPSRPDSGTRECLLTSFVTFENASHASSEKGLRVITAWEF